MAGREEDDDLQVVHNEDDPILVPSSPSYGTNVSPINTAGDTPEIVVVNPTNTSIIALFTGMTWRQRLTLFTAAFINFSSLACFSMMAPFLPLEADNKDISSTMVGMIFACFQLVNFIGSLIFGRFLTTIGARFVYIAGVLIGAVCSVLFGFLEWCPPGTIFVVMAISCRVVEAVGFSMAQTAASAIVANEFPDRIATIFGLLESVAGLGLMVGPTIGGALYDLGGFFMPFVVMGGLLFLAGIAASATLPSVAVPATKDKAELFRRFMSVPAVPICGICILTCASMISFFDPVLSNQLAAIDETLANSQTLIGLVFLVMPALYAILSPFVGHLADTFKHQVPLLVMGNVGFVILFILIGPCPLLPIPPKLLWLTIFSLVLLGFFIAFCFMPAFAIINKGCLKAGLPNDLDLYGLIAGFFGFVFNLGGFAGPLLGGILVQQFGFEWATSMMALVPIVNLTVLIGFSIYSRVHTEQQVVTP